MFSNRDLKNMIVPLYWEQPVVILMGMAWAMCPDWVVRGMIFYLCFSHRKWKVFQAI